ncbi:MAG: prepilin-type N-terminal cleavage/methylation domain-containing protein [Candidatus Omnitrophica bacterium]|nr:prepilin-type N-terminal cleavage/methylation domain-containing protein [Candidatus Omnitrophota bacterium]
MMLKIGSKKQAFTLIEVMLATMVLSLGAVLIHEAFFKSLDTYNYCHNYFSVGYWLNEKMWSVQDSLRQSGPLVNVARGGKFKAGNKDFTWNLSYDLAYDTEDLYKIVLDVSWQEGSRDIHVSRAAFAKYVEKK